LTGIGLKPLIPLKIKKTGRLFIKIAFRFIIIRGSVPVPGFKERDPDIKSCKVNLLGILHQIIGDRAQANLKGMHKSDHIHLVIGNRVNAAFHPAKEFLRPFFRISYFKHEKIRWLLGDLLLRRNLFDDINKMPSDYSPHPGFIEYFGAGQDLPFPVKRGQISK
jgi:hypothetical protein